MYEYTVDPIIMKDTLGPAIILVGRYPLLGGLKESIGKSCLGTRKLVVITYDHRGFCIVSLYEVSFIRGSTVVTAVAVLNMCTCRLFFFFFASCSKELMT